MITEKQQRNNLAALGVIAIVFSLMCAVSWKKWAAIEIDSGSVMNVPLRVLNGESLYSEVYFLYGPLAPYLDVWLYKIFGVHLNTLYFTGIFCTLLLLLILFQLGKRFMGTTEVTLAVLAVATFCVFKTGAGTIFPYTHAALYGTLLGTSALLLQIRFTESQKSANLLLSGILGGLAWITKMEFGFATLATTIALIISSSRGHRLKIAMLSLLPAVIIPACTYIAFSFKMPLNVLARDTFLLPQYIPRELLYFARRRSGLLNIGKTMAEMAGGTMILASFAGLIGLISIYLARKNQQENQTVPRVWVHWLYYLGVGGSALLAIIILSLGTVDQISPLRALPLLGVLLIYRYLVKDSEQKQEPRDQIIFLLSVYSLAVLGRLITRVPSGGSYGAVLLPVPILLFTYSVTTVYPRLFSRFTKIQQYARMFALILFSLTVAVSLLGFANRYRKEPRFTLQTGRGTLHVLTPFGPAVDAALKFASQNTVKGEYILVLPEGSGINFLADRATPLRYDVLTPGFLNIQGEKQAIERMIEKKVPYVFLLNRPTREFGAAAFGKDYYRELGGWIEDNYEVAAVFGENVSVNSKIGDGHFFIKCYRLKSRLH